MASVERLANRPNGGSRNLSPSTVYKRSTIAVPMVVRKRSCRSIKLFGVASRRM